MRWVGWVLAGVAWCWVAGCASRAEEGYVFGGGYRADVESVAVPVFRNETFEGGVEAALTEAVIKRLETDTPWTTAGRDVADTELRGTVTGFDLVPLVTDSDTGLVSQMGVVVTVSFEWTDRRTGEVLLSRGNFSGSDFFVPSEGAGEPVEVGRAGAVERTARGIVSSMRSSW